MKTFKNISILFLIAIATTFSTSCSSDDGGSGGNAAAGTMKAKVAGTNVTTLEITTFATISNNVLILQGNTGGTSSKAFNINVGAYNGVGTYDIGGGATGLGQATASYIEILVDIANPTAFQSTTWAAPYTGGAKVGEVSVSEVTATNIKGTFYFNARKTTGDNAILAITEGAFNIEL
jgi:hypothetical protein